jgi:glutamate-5-semialdehyde dehydrogenase
MSNAERRLAALELAERARAASRALARSSSEQRQRALIAFASELEGPALAAAIEAANSADVANASGQSAAFIDRLRLDSRRLAALALAVREVAAQPDPVGEVVERTTRPNGLLVERVRSPIGTVLMIYESRPGVTAEAAALCVRSGNAALLRGGTEALQSNSALVDAFQRALVSAGLPEDAVQLVPPDRALLDDLLQLEGRIDLCIPRGGPSLIRFIADRSRIPVVKHDQGVCHLYVAADADIAQAARIAVNAKAQRPGVCNALECLLVDSRIAAEALPQLGQALRAAGVELRADERALPHLPFAQRAAADDFGREFLDLKLAVAVVDGIEGALGHIARYGSRHTEAICTRDPRLAERFVKEVDASCALINASTRFNDGGELGLGAEIGISTSKLHAYGPMGLRELTCTRFVVRGDGQVRT